MPPGSSGVLFCTRQQHADAIAVELAAFEFVIEQKAPGSKSHTGV
jgi:hypothetical protein